LSDVLEQEIRTLRAHFWSDRDPDGRAFAPLADAYRRKGDLAEAESLVQDGLGRLPDFATGRLVAALVRREQGRLEEAMAELDRLLELDPRNVMGLVERAGVSALLGDREGALQDAELALELEPGHGGAEAVLDELEEPTGELEGMEAEAPEGEAAFHLEDEPAPAVEVVADEEVETPAPILEAASSEEAPGAVATRTLGELYARQGALERAVDVYERLVEASPDDPELTGRLAELRAQVEGGDAPDARAPKWPDAAGSPESPDEAEVSPWGGASDEGEEGASAGRPIRDYFQQLMAWVPGAVPIQSLAPTAAGPVPIETLAPDAASDGFRG
jgi:tetratricopeptide (TPR) repeat protein